MRNGAWLRSDVPWCLASVAGLVAELCPQSLIFLLQHQDEADAGEVQAQGEKLRDPSKGYQVLLAVAARAAYGTPRYQ